jgi:hypothetical protein
MNFEILSSLARIRGDELAQEAERRRLRRRARRTRPATHAVRLRLARAVRRAGSYALALGDRLAETR